MEVSQTTAVWRLTCGGEESGKEEDRKHCGCRSRIKSQSVTGPHESDLGFYTPQASLLLCTYPLDTTMFCITHSFTKTWRTLSACFNGLPLVMKIEIQACLYTFITRWLMTNSLLHLHLGGRMTDGQSHAILRPPPICAASPAERTIPAPGCVWGCACGSSGKKKFFGCWSPA